MADSEQPERKSYARVPTPLEPYRAQNLMLPTFFQTYPLYRRCTVITEDVPEKLVLRSNLRLVLRCPVCKVPRSFALERTDEPRVIPGTPALIAFRCTHCTQAAFSFALLVDEQKDADHNKSVYSVQKIGQFPSMRKEAPAALQSLLSEKDQDLLSKGLTAENHGFGIGAFAYYRRVTESVIDALLASLVTFAMESEDNRLQDAVALLGNEQQASKKIDAVKDLLPDSLRPGGFNPLGRLYELLSEGIHSLSDEQCLDHASALLTVLTTLIGQVAQQRQASTAYKMAAQKMLDKGQAGQRSED